MSEKTFKEIHGKTKFGLWLKEKAPDLLGTVLNVAGDLIPGGSAFKSVVGGLIGESKEVTPQDREHALKMIEFQIVEEQEKTKRWESDTSAQDWLPRNIRPLVVANFTLLIDFVLIASQFGRPIAEAYLPILMTMGVTAIGGYFTLREFGKSKSK